MKLENYSLKSPSTVIGDDERDPYVSWKNHLVRTGGLRGGVDIVAAIGTPIVARTSGTVKWLPNNGSAGNSMEFAHDANPGWRDVFSHLSLYVGWSGKHFEKGEVVAYSGNSGGVTQHLHWHLLDPNGNRKNPWDYFSPEKVPVKPIITEDTVTFNVRNTDTGHIYNCGVQFIKHLNMHEADIHMLVTSTLDERHQLNNDDFKALIDSLAIERGQVYGLDGSTVPFGHVWSIDHDIRNKLNELTQNRN